MTTGLKRWIPGLLLAAGAVPSAAAASEAVARPPLKCSAEKFGPILDFEFRFLAGGRLGAPVKEYRGRKPRFRVLLTVTPIDGTPGGAERLFDEVEATQEIPEDAKGQLVFSPSFSVGEGRYRVEWSIEDDAGRSCGGAWKLKASLSRGQKAVEIALEPGRIVEAGVYLFREEPAVERPHLDSPRRLKIFVSMDIRRRRGRVSRPSLWRIHPHLSAIRHLARSRGFNEFSVVMFSFEDQKVVHRQDYEPRVRFSPMQRILDKLDPQRVDIAQLGKGREMDFFESMLSDELLLGAAPDAVVFVGQETHYGSRLSEFMLDRLRRTEAEFAFIDTARAAWKGAMGNVVRAMNGKEYPMRQPSDLSKALLAIAKQIGGEARL